jgi:hypothetical protein
MKRAPRHPTLRLLLLVLAAALLLGGCLDYFPLGKAETRAPPKPVDAGSSAASSFSKGAPVPTAPDAAN